ncbi:MAG: TQO small subunit DoxD, partial [Chloroflexota bacterium]
VTAWEEIFRKVVLVLARLLVAVLFFANLFWKMPPSFNCPPDFAFTTANADGKLVRTSGLCDWVGVEAVWSHRPRQFFVVNLDNQGSPEIALDVSWAARLNGLFLENFVMPHIRWFGYVVWGMEAFIFVSLLLGLLGRLGALVAIAQSAQLQLGLAGISSPFEWEWGYHLMVMVSLLVFAFAPGRILGLDAWLRPRLQAAAEGGNRLAGWLRWLT